MLRKKPRRHLSGGMEGNTAEGGLKPLGEILEPNLPKKNRKGPTFGAVLIFTQLLRWRWEDSLSRDCAKASSL